MRTRTLASLALAVVAATLAVPAAQAGPPVDGPKGRICSYDANSDPAPDADDDAMTGVIQGGPLVWDKPFTLHCHIQVNDPNGGGSPAWDSHADSTPVDSTGYHVAALGEPINYISGETAQDYLCAQVDYSGGTLYWHAANNGPDGLPGTLDDEAGHWTTVAGKPCSAATQISTGPAIDALFGILDPVLTILDGLERTVVDPILCSVLKQLYPTLANGPLVFVDSEGDVFLGDQTEDSLFWDCPTYMPLDAVNGVFDN